MRSTIEEKSQQARDKVFEIFEAIRAFIVDKITAAKNTVGTVLEGIRSFFVDKFTAAKNKVEEIVGGIKSFIIGRLEDMKRGVGVILGLIPNIFRDNFQGAISWVRTKLIALGTEIRSWPAKIFEWAKDIGKAIVNGILDGLGNLASSVGSAIGGALSSIPGAGIIGNVAGAVGGFFGGGSSGGNIAGSLGATGIGALFAHGGIVTKPTRALIGEAGPEAVIPLDSPLGRGLGGGGNLTIIVEGSLFGAASVEDLIDIIETARRDRSLRGGALVG